MNNTNTPSPTKRSSVPSNIWIKAAERGVIFPQNSHHLFRLGDLRERREAAQIAENDRHLAPMTFKRLHCRRRQDQIGDLRRKEPLQAVRALDLDHLLGDPPFQRDVQFRELGRLPLGAVVQFFDPQHRTHARDERVLINRLGQVFIRSRFQAGDDVLRVGAGGDENDRDESDAWIASQPPARLEPVHPRHRHVEQDQVGRIAAHRFQRLRPIGGFRRRIALRAKARGEDRAVVLVVVDDQDAGRIVHAAAHIGCSRNCPIFASS